MIKAITPILVLLIVSFIVLTTFAQAQTSDALRILKVRIATDQESRKQANWENIIRERMKEVSGLFEKKFKIRFEILDIVPWDSPNPGMPVGEAEMRDSLIEKVPLSNADIVVGFSARDFSEAAGYGSHYDRYAVISKDGHEKGPNEPMLTTAHEILHLFGMFHVADKGSIMHKMPGENIGNYTLRHMHLMRKFDFVKGIDSISIDTIKKLDEIYMEGCIKEEKISATPLASAYHERGGRFYQKGKFDEAIKDYRKAMALGSNETYDYMDLGIVLMKKKELPEAAVLFQKAISVYPVNPYAHSLLADALSMQGKHSEALAERKEAVRLKLDDSKYRTDLGKTLMALTRHDEAVREFQTAIKLDPKNINPRYNLGLVYNKLKKYPEAVAEFREMSRLAPQIPEPHLQAGIILLYYMQKPEEAAKELAELVRLKPKDAMVHFHYGTALFNINGKTNEAIAEFKEAVALEPNNVNFQKTLEEALKSQGSIPSGK